MTKTVKEEQIAYIKKVLKEWGPTTAGELGLGYSPCINSLGDGDVCELAEHFNSDGVGTTIYGKNGEEIDWWNYLYEELSDDVITEIEEVIQNYEADMIRTEKRCQS